MTVMQTRPNAEDHLAACKAFAIDLANEYDKHTPDRDKIARLSSKIGRGIKFAEVRALIRIGDQLERLVEAAPGQYLVEHQAGPVTLSGECGFHAYDDNGRCVSCKASA